MLITPAYAQAGGGDSSSMLVQLAPLVLIFVVFYFFLIRPQQQKAKQQKAMLSAIRRGDRVITAGGLMGMVAKVVSDDELLVDLAENVRVRVVRSTISQVLARTEPAAAKADEAKDPKSGDSSPSAAPNDGPADTPVWKKFFGLR